MNVQVTKFIVEKKKDNINITDISLLTKEEYERNMDIIIPIRGAWWLRTGYENYVAEAYIVPYEELEPENYHVSMPVGVGVRPAVYCSDTFEIGDKIELDGNTYTAIEPHILLCDGIIVEMAFRKDILDIVKKETMNDYNYSDIKKYLKKKFFNLFNV